MPFSFSCPLYLSELTHVLSSLASILEKKALAPGKLDEIKKKANILAAFVQEKVEEVTEEAKEGAEALKDKAEEAIKHAKEEL